MQPCTAKRETLIHLPSKSCPPKSTEAQASAKLSLNGSSSNAVNYNTNITFIGELKEGRKT